eukprot:766941-Hanusia_phi.AAC.1
MVAGNDMSDSRRLSMRQTKRMTSPLRESSGSAARDLVLLDKVAEEFERAGEPRQQAGKENQMPAYMPAAVSHSASFHDVRRVTCSPIPVHRRPNDSTESQVIS